jgi:hypothetical protein
MKKVDAARLEMPSNDFRTHKGVSQRDLIESIRVIVNVGEQGAGS